MCMRCCFLKIISSLRLGIIMSGGYMKKTPVSEINPPLEDYWGAGYVDIEALASTKGGIHYVAKYLGKLHGLGSGDTLPEAGANPDSNMSSLINQASLTTLSLMWVYRKRSYSLSRDLSDLIQALHNQNCGTKIELIQVDLEGGAAAERLPQWVLCGFFAGELVKGGRLKWSVPLSSAEYREIKGSGSFVDRLGGVL